MLYYLGSTVFFYLTYMGLDQYFPQYFPESSDIVTKKYRTEAAQLTAFTGVVDHPSNWRFALFCLR